MAVELVLGRAPAVHGIFAAVAAPYELARVRADFPALSRMISGKPLAYLDNASTTQKPSAVLDAMNRFYATSCANVHRAVHTLSVEATDLYEEARARVARMIGARDPRELVFVRGTTEAINLVAASLGEARVGAGDEVLITELEHHSNLVPWQRLCARRGAKLAVLPIDDRGELAMDRLEGMLSERTKIVAVSQVSNSLGTVNDVAEVVRAAHRAGAVCLVDGAQAVAHRPVDVAALDCDFYAFSAHKMYGPMGIGVLFGKRALLEEMAPWQSGGDMVLEVHFEETTYNAVPYKFEAGTPNVAGAIGLAAAADYLELLGMDFILTHERALLAQAEAALRGLRGVRMIGTPRERAGVISFEVEGVHAHDVATVLDGAGIAVRSGHHCTQPVMEHFGVPATVRASFGVYNGAEEIDRLVAALDEVRRIFA